MADCELEIGQEPEHFEPLHRSMSISPDVAREVALASPGESEHPLKRRGFYALISVLGLMAVWSAMPRASPSDASEAIWGNITSGNLSDAQVQDASKAMFQQKFAPDEEARAWMALGGKAQAAMMTPEQEKAQSDRLVVHAKCAAHPKCGKDIGLCCPNEYGQMLGCCDYHVLNYDPVLHWGQYTVRRDFHPDPPWRSAPPKPGWTYWNPNNVIVLPESNQLQVCVTKTSGFLYSWQHGIVPHTGPEQAWANGEAVFEDQLHYGTYIVSFNLVDANGASAIDRLLSTDVTFTAGIFIFDLKDGGEGENKHRELDLIEVGYQNQNRMDPKAWINNQPHGPAITKSNAHFAVQPVKIEAGNDGNQTSNWDHVHRISIDPAKMMEKNGMTLAMLWHGPKKPVKFFAAPGDFTSANFPFKDADTMKWKTPKSAWKDVPSRTDSQRLHINLWAYGGPASNQPFCMRVNSVELPPAPKNHASKHVEVRTLK
eukprot:TRINITY_DN5029_c0_g1_i4.p1 TRINITY_DN5029_c0_g1~~TRINITY_DN5029_c0_g1_i4.p1  ORF type:complete len:485 (-),score=78.61 TRINITY_DN5029_c0_g1_i4:46-1500(-)